MMLVPRLRAPIVLIHGLLGFDRFSVWGWNFISYFSRIPEFLSAAGNRVLVAQLSPTGPIKQRAAQLQAFLERESPQEPVHLIAHSMGGLDSRYMISCLGMGQRVLTLTTLGTPHRGTPFADWGIKRFEPIWRPILDRLNIPCEAINDLTTARCREFNEQVIDAPGVRYFSIAGRHQESWNSPHWQLSQPMVTQAEGPNDGIVSIASATYGESCAIWEGDHLSLINWLNPVTACQGDDRANHYAGLIQRLADEGF
jgi:triacylglycerol lipase